MKPITEDFKSLVGRSHDMANCWDIVREFYFKCFGVELKQYYQYYTGERKQTESLIQSNYNDFSKVEFKDINELQFGDIVILKLHGVESHIGVICGMGKMFHSTKTSGSVIESLDKWKTCIAGVYRLKDSQ